jgi:hypothetical protein
LWNRILSRGNLLTATGLAGFFYELIVTGKDRPFILAFCAALVGLRFTLPNGK